MSTASGEGSARCGARWSSTASTLRAISSPAGSGTGFSGRGLAPAQAGALAGRNGRRAPRPRRGKLGPGLSHPSRPRHPCRTGFQTGGPRRPLPLDARRRAGGEIARPRGRGPGPPRGRRRPDPLCACALSVIVLAGLLLGPRGERARSALDLAAFPAGSLAALQAGGHWRALRQLVLALLPASRAVGFAVKRSPPAELDAILSDAAPWARFPGRRRRPGLPRRGRTARHSVTAPARSTIRSNPSGRSLPSRPASVSRSHRRTAPARGAARRRGSR